MLSLKLSSPLCLHNNLQLLTKKIKNVTTKIKVKVTYSRPWRNIKTVKERAVLATWEDRLETLPSFLCTTLEYLKKDYSVFQDEFTHKVILTNEC